MDGMNKILTARAIRLEHPEEVADILGSGFILAGGALSSDDPPKDFDIFRPEGIDISQMRGWLHCRMPQWTLLSETSNAVTARHCGQIIQFCAYRKETPEKLIEAFDFSHCQAAAVFERDGSLARTVNTPKFHDFVLSGHTRYTGSEYPLASLMRCAKFISRGLIATPAEWKPIIMDIITDVVRRGFEDEDDYSDQCASISESFRDMNSDASDLFTLLNRTTKEATA